MGTTTNNRSLLPATLSLLAVCLSLSQPPYCQAAIAPLTDHRRQNYSQLMQDIKSHPIVTHKIPPIVTDAQYDAQPLEGGGGAIVVSLYFLPVDILQLDPAAQVLHMSAYLSVLWWDTGLAWNTSDYGGVTMVEISSADLWTPALSVVNGAEDSDILSDRTAPITLQSSGMMTLPLSLNLKTSCTLDLTFFPFDKQSCDIIMGTASQFRLHLHLAEQGLSILLEEFSAGGEWSVTDIQFVQTTGSASQVNVNASKVTLTLERSTTFYLVSVVGPMGLFTAMNCLVFLIPPESGEKISFLISIFLSNTVFSSFINGVMPRALDKMVSVFLFFLY